MNTGWLSAVYHRPFIYNPPQGPLEIIHEDKDVLIVNKPAGLLSVRGRLSAHQDSLEARVQALWPHARIVHRLDLDTSGVLVLALNPRAHKALGRQFEKRIIKKSYEALLWGELHSRQGIIELPLIVDWANRPRQILSYQHGRMAITEFTCLNFSHGISHVQLKPVTGRTHQLRVHMLALGHPILGDSLYAPDKAYRTLPRLALHASTLELRHPENGDWHHFKSVCDFKEIRSSANYPG